MTSGGYSDRDPVLNGRSEERGSRLNRHQHLSMVAKGGILNLVGAAVGGALSFAIVVVVTRGLGAGKAGAFFVAVALFSVLAKTLELGADVGIVRAISRDLALGKIADARRVLQVALLPVLLGGGLVGCLVWGSAANLARILAPRSPASVLTSLLRALAPFLPAMSGATVLLAATRGFGTMLPTVLLDRFVKPAIQPVAILVALAAGLGAPSAAVAWALPIALTAILAAAWVLILVRRAERRSNLDEAPARYGAVARAFWSFSAPRGLAGLFQVAIAWVDTLMIGSLKSAREAGIYTAATRYLLVTTLTSLAIVQVVSPKLGELMAREDRNMATAVYQAATGWLVLLAWPVNLTILLFTPVLLSIFGDAFHAGGPALSIVAGAALFATAAGPVDVVLLMAGKSTWNLANTAVAMLANIGLNLVLIPHLGMSGAAIAWASSIVLNNLLPLVQVWRGLGMHPFGRGTIKALIATVAAFGVIGFLIRLWLGATHVGFAAFVVATPPIYVGLVWRFRSELELSIVRSALQALQRSRRAITAQTPDLRPFA